MRKIIGGKVYDTTKATKVAEWDNMYDVSNFEHYSETLHRKRTGEYFIHGEGGPASKYGKSLGNNTWGGGESIVPMDYERARQWMEEHADADDYEREFGVVDEDSESVRLHIRIAASTKARLDRYAAQNGMTLGEAIESLVNGA